MCNILGETVILTLRFTETLNEKIKATSNFQTKETSASGTTDNLMEELNKWKEKTYKSQDELNAK